MPQVTGTRLTTDESDRRWDEYSLRNLKGNYVRWMADSWAFHAPLYERIERAVEPGGQILEVGAGGAQNLIWLGAHGYRCTGVEYRPAVVEAAQELARRIEVDVQLDVDDAFDLSGYRGFDLAYSLGMIEHWEPERSVEALRQQAQAARIVIAVIPTENTRFAGQITDERFYTPRALRKLATKAGLENVRSFAYGEAPSRTAHAASRVVPPVILSRIQDATRWGAMNHAVIGTSAAARS